MEFLLQQELRETPNYNFIIEAVALENTKLNEISQNSLVEDMSKTGVYLRNLIELGIVEREFSVDAKLKDKTNTTRGAYRLTDNFFRSGMPFGFTNFSQLEDGDVEGVYDYVVELALHKFASFNFADVGKEFIKERQKRNALPFRYSRMGRWTDKTTICDERSESGVRMGKTEINLLANDQDAKNYLVRECKFKKQLFSCGEYLDALVKLSPKKDMAPFYYVLFSGNGFDDRIIDAASHDERLSLYNLETIVNY